MRTRFIALCISFILLLGSVGESIADSLSDAVDAYNAGEYQTAERIFMQFAKQGFADAQFNLALMYDNGKGVPQDYQTVLKWWTSAAEQGFAEAQYSLGLMYDNGHGVPQDDVYAHMWHNISAYNGDIKASENRDLIAKRMTPSQIEKAQTLAHACVSKEYKDC